MCRVWIHITDEGGSSEMREGKMSTRAFYPAASPQRRLGKRRAQTVLQECAAIFRLFTVGAASPAGSHTQTLSHSALTLSAALLRSKVTTDSLAQTPTPLLRTVSRFKNLVLVLQKHSSV